MKLAIQDSTLALTFQLQMLLVTVKKIPKVIKPHTADLLSKMRVFYLALLAICIVVEFIQNIFTSSSESILSSDEKDSAKSIENNNVLTKF